MRKSAPDTFDAAVGAMQAKSARPLLEARGLAFAADGQRLIDGIDLTVGAERRLVIMGANGAGKSLLLRLMHGLIKPSDGSVRWQGGPLDRAARNRQAMVFQRSVLLRRSVRANLQFALAVRNVRRGDRAARGVRALEQAHLSDLAHRPARALSGGEQQRLAVIRALACEPDLLFLDEPTASLDPASTEAIEDLINMAHARRVAVVMATHDTGQARRLGDDIAFIHAGRLAEFGPVSHVLDDPQSEPLKAWLDGRLYHEPLGTTT